MKLLTELKKTTTLVERKSKAIDLNQLLHELSIMSINHFGNPSHFFPIGQNRYALVNADDVVLFTNDDMKQQLVCLNKERNFTVYAPNLKVRLW